MKSKNIGLDLDGVIFDFNSNFVNLARAKFPDQMLGCPDPSSVWPVKWDYLDDYLPKHNTRQLWDFICHDSISFWASCPSYAWAADLLAQAYGQGQSIYFITSRQGKFVQEQTEEALEKICLLSNQVFTGAVIPVQKPEDKLPLIRALRLTHFLDDKKETVEMAWATCPDTQVAVWDRPWNQQMTSAIPRLKSVEEFSEWLSQ